MYLPLIDVRLELGPFYYVLLFLVVAGGANAVNLTDGLDGLAAGTMTIAMLTYTAMMVVAFLSPGGLTAEGAASRIDLAIIGAAMVGGCVGFLWYNAYPADVFMGDTGSFGLGGALAAMAVFTKTEFLLVLIGGVFVVEALSVAIQVLWFKTTRRRVFLMAPIHHHFEMLEWTENKIIVRFWIRPRSAAPAASSSTTWPTPSSGEQTALPGRSACAARASRPARRSAGRGRRPRWSRRRRRRRTWTRRGFGARRSNTWSGGEDVSMARLTALIKSPGVPGGAPLVERGAGGRRAGVERGRAGGADAGQPDRRDHRHQRQDHHHRADRGDAAGRRPRRGGGRQRRAGAGRAARPDRPTDAWVVCELSSFQLEDIDTFRCRVAVVLNITPDHLDRHGTIERYRGAASCACSRTRRPSDVAVLNGDDPLLRAADLPGDGRRVWFDRSQSDRVDWEHAGIRGDHNLENSIAAAALAAEAVGVPRDARDRALREFAAAAAPASAGGRARRRQLRGRLQGDQPGGRDQGADRVSTAASI